MRRIALLSFLLWGCLFLVTFASDVQNRILERGLELEEEGHYEEALQVWLEAKMELRTPSTDIGTEYIRLVTEQKMKKYYPAASAMYLWGLSADDVQPNRIALREELNRLEPLVEDREYKVWKNLLEDENSTLYDELRLWWELRDLTPSTPYNERLVEHWERIAYAREHFTRHKRSIYGTDNRGPVYVKYGRPDRRYKDRLRIASHEVCSAIKERLSIQGLYVPCNEKGVRKIENLVMDFHQNPEYEIWVYQAPNEDMQFNLVMMFGEKGQIGGFQHLETVEDFIPARAFSMSKRNHYRGITPGIIMQWLYYKQLASVDYYFSNAFTNLDFRFMRNERPMDQLFLGGSLKQKHYHLTRQNLNAAPEEVSTHGKDLSSIPMDIHQYRLLDEKNRPIFATIFESQPQHAFLQDFAYNQDYMLEGNPELGDTTSVKEALSNYRLYHGLQLREKDGKLLSQERIQPALVIDGNNMETRSGSVFLVPYASEIDRQVFFAELHNRHPETEPRVETAFPDNLRGLGKQIFNQPEPLDNDPANLQMGDLILGYQMKEKEESSRSLFPFVVSSGRKLPDGENLAIHFEVYHLKTNAGGLTSFTVDYEIRPVNWLGWTKEREDQLTVSLQYEHDSRRFTDNLEIEAARLEPGRYVLRMKATDRVSGQEIKRELEFEVVE